MNPPEIRTLFRGVAESIIAHTEELTALDAAIGDGDHGLNMHRGMQAILDDLDRIASKPLPEALTAAGATLVMKVGGASGPLYGTLLMALGKEMPPDPTLADAVKAFGLAIAAVQARGKSERGQKTMLDVLIPVHEALSLASDGTDSVRLATAKAAAATIEMKAIRGRASFLGDRSVGHLDPGARSSQLMIEAVLDVIGGKT